MTVSIESKINMKRYQKNPATPATKQLIPHEHGQRPELSIVFEMKENLSEKQISLRICEIKQTACSATEN